MAPDPIADCTCEWPPDSHERMIWRGGGEGKEREAPTRKIKIQIFPTVVALLSLGQTNRPDAGRVSNFC